MIPLLFRDDKFEQPGAWEQTLGETHFHQRFLHEEDLIYCETLMTVHGATDIDAAVSHIRAPWDWWEHGRSTDFVTHEDGTHDQTLAPVWWFMTRVGVRTFPPGALPGLKGQRVSILLSGDFSGVSSMDVYPDPGNAALIIRGRFHGVKYEVPLIPDALAEGLHMEAESGTMPAPFPKGTGWIGLLRLLEPAWASCGRPGREQGVSVPG